MDLHSLLWVAVLGYHEVPGLISSNGYSSQVKWPILCADLLEDWAVAGVTCKEEPALLVEDGEATPQALSPVIASVAPVLHTQDQLSAFAHTDYVLLEVPMAWEQYCDAFMSAEAYSYRHRTLSYTEIHSIRLHAQVRALARTAMQPKLCGVSGIKIFLKLLARKQHLSWGESHCDVAAFVLHFLPPVKVNDILLRDAAADEPFAQLEGNIPAKVWIHQGQLLKNSQPMLSGM